MKRLLPLVLFALVAGFSAWMLSGGGEAPPLGGAPAAVEPRPGEATDLAGTAVESTPQVERRAVAGSEPVPSDSDPRYEAALARFTGRILDAQLRPVADAEVRLYRAAIDSIVNPGVDVFVDEVQAEPRVDAGSTRTDEEGRFELRRVSPRSFHLLHAACDHDHPTWRILQRSPGPAETVDLGDIVLEELGVLTGVVVGPEGKPLEGALIRAVDLPGSVLGFVPVERLDPEGALIVTERDKMVITAPPWFADRFALLPIPRTESDAEGKFRLTGVYPGGNVVATTKRGLQSNVRPQVMVQAGEEKDLGTLRLPEGELVYGKVVDQQGRPVAGAEVLVASQSIGAPVHFASFTAPTDADGVFEMGGLPARDAVVAARRGGGQPGGISAPQSPADDFLITLPSEHVLTLRVFGPAGEVIMDPRLQVLSGERNDGAVELAMWGVRKPLSLEDRRQRLEDGAQRIEALPAGEYTILVQAEGCAATAVSVKLDQDQEQRVELKASQAFAVRVLDPDAKPLRNADVLVYADGERGLPDFPRHVGRTDAKGELRVDEARAKQVTVMAEHPEFGMVAEELPLPTQVPLQLQFAQPGVIEGLLTANGAPPPAGQWLLTAISWGKGANMPRTTLADAEGGFVFRGLAPGNYMISASDSLDAIRSPGGLMNSFRGAFFFGGFGDSRSTQVELAPGGTAQARIELEAPQELEGPSVRITGFVTVDGRPAAGHRITGWSSGRPFDAEVDDHGRFDLGQVAVGWAHLQLQSKSSSPNSGPSFGSDQLWQKSFELEESGDLDLTIEIQTTAIAGVVLGQDGRPAANIAIQVQGRIGEEGNQTRIHRRTLTDSDGRFELQPVPAGIYELAVQDESGSGRIVEIEALAGRPLTGLRLQLHQCFEVSGTVDMSAFGEPRPRRVWIQLRADEGSLSAQPQSARLQDDGSFSISDLPAGSYQVSFHVSPAKDGKPITAAYDGQIAVHGDVHALRIRPTVTVREPKPPTSEETQ